MECTLSLFFYLNATSCLALFRKIPYSPTNFTGQYSHPETSKSIKSINSDPGRHEHSPKDPNERYTPDVGNH